MERTLKHLNNSYQIKQSASVDSARLEKSCFWFVGRVVTAPNLGYYWGLKGLSAVTKSESNKTERCVSFKIRTKCWRKQMVFKFP